MDGQHHHKMREKVQGGKESEGQQEAKQQQLLVPASPPSSSTSPAHEFSFTISLHHQQQLQQPSSLKPPPPSVAVDLSPADEIFFHGHLLPLHLLSHLPVSPRSSINSLDSFTLPIKELLEDQNPNKISTNTSTNSETIERPRPGPNPKPKSKSFSLFGIPRRPKGIEEREAEEREKRKRKGRFDVSHVLKRYMRMIRPLLSFRGRRENLQLRRQPYSFSGYLSPRNKQEVRGRRGDFSAPASMSTSPTNSGLLLPIPPPKSDSTMEELQAAVQAAIAHCKNSIAVEEKIIKC